MKIHRHRYLSGMGFSRLIRAKGWPVAAALVLFAGSLAGQLTPSPEEKAAPSVKPESLVGKVMEELPHYGEIPTPAAEPKVLAEIAPETVHLVPFVVFGDKRIRLLKSDLLTQKAFASDLFKRYDHSVFSSFQHREDVRLENMDSLQTYADNLMLAGDVEESRAIKKENSRLFLRPHDPESEYILSVFNPRIR